MQLAVYSEYPTRRQNEGRFFTFSVHLKTIDMKKIVKQVVGVDVAQKELVICLGRMHDDWTPELYLRKAFANNLKGFERLLGLVHKQTQSDVGIRFVMEATGVYHEPFAYFLAEMGHEVSIVLPTKISSYMRTLDTKTITDQTAAEAITLFGLERKLEKWEKPNEVYRKLRQLTRERDQLVEERQTVKNKLHAEQSEALPNKDSIARMQKRIKLLDEQEKAIKQDIAAVVSTDEQAKKSMDHICSLPGMGPTTAAIILAETNGFELIRNKRQLTSYAGFDVTEKQSGTSVKGRPRISKRGNKHLRKALHMPSLSAVRHDGRFKAIFVGLVSKHGIKMKALVAVQRKLLEMAYILCKRNAAYDKAYLEKLAELQSPA
jgi:transposase